MPAATPGFRSYPVRPVRRNRERNVPRFSNVGGVLGFGPVDTADSYKPFEWVWEGRVWALSMLLPSKGLHTTDEKRDVGEQMTAEQQIGLSYYERWLLGLEILLEESGHLDRAALDGLTEQAENAGDGGHGHWHPEETTSQWEARYE
jgi:hypothetical protein